MAGEREVGCVQWEPREVQQDLDMQLAMFKNSGKVFFIFLQYLIVPNRRERYKYFTFILDGFSHICSRFCCIPSGAEGKDFIAGKKLEEKKRRIERDSGSEKRQRTRKGSFH